LEWHAALLVYWQLCNQMRARHPTWRDDIYRSRRDNGRHRHGINARQRCRGSEGRRSNVHIDDRRRCIIGGYGADEVDGDGYGDSDSDGDDDDDGELSSRFEDDDHFDDDDRDDDMITPSQIEELQIMSEYAIWAYEPNKESLRSYLLSSSSSLPLPPPSPPPLSSSGKPMPSGESGRPGDEGSNG